MKPTMKPLLLALFTFAGITGVAHADPSAPPLPAELRSLTDEYLRILREEKIESSQMQSDVMSLLNQTTDEVITHSTLIQNTYVLELMHRYIAVPEDRQGIETIYGFLARKNGSRLKDQREYSDIHTLVRWAAGAYFAVLTLETGGRALWRWGAGTTFSEAKTFGAALRQAYDSCPGSLRAKLVRSLISTSAGAARVALHRRSVDLDDPILVLEQARIQVITPIYERMLSFTAQVNELKKSVEQFQSDPLRFQAQVNQLGRDLEALKADYDRAAVGIPQAGQMHEAFHLNEESNRAKLTSWTQYLEQVQAGLNPPLPRD